MGTCNKLGIATMLESNLCVPCFSFAFLARNEKINKLKVEAATDKPQKIKFNIIGRNLT
jgi:hypothetical protein